MDQLKPLIAEMIKLVESGKDVLSGQLPDVCQQIVRLYFWGNVIEIPIQLGLMALGIWFGWWCYQKARADDWAEAPWLLAWAPIGILEVVIGFYAYGCGQTLLKAWLAPKVLIIEQLRAFL